MQLKTNIHAEEGKQEIFITREFDLSVHQLFRAYTEAEIIEIWMGTKVEKWENNRHGSYRFVTTDPMGNPHGFNGTIHEIQEDALIIRTFEMENSPFPVQLEYISFEAMGKDKSRITIHTLFKSVGDRDAMLKLPFAQGLNMAHNRIEKYFSEA